MGILPKFNDQRRISMERKLIRFESKIGSQLFGPILKNRHREFFCLDERTWIWHEDWLDNQGNRQVLSTKYIIRPEGIIKAQNGQAYRLVEDDEKNNLVHAIKQYIQMVKNEYTRILEPQTN